ncbi:MAG: hypothetical protein QMD85_04660 [Candidatus Aenigmarchaeota archaeon]|nr:hypothetical protein [Candidatus Aenigmarchaeota archaeon]
MVLGIKLIIAAIITAGLLGAFLLTNPTVGNFAGKIGGSVEEIKNVPFTLQTNHYDEFGFDKQKKLNIVISGKTSGNIGDVSFSTEKEVSIKGFSGKGSVARNAITLNGSIDRIELPDISMSFRQKKYDSYSEFSSVYIENLELSGLELANATGILNQSGVEIKFSNMAIAIEGVEGKFSLGKGLEIDGFAKKVFLPKTGVRIG